jgi:site-specific DNA recombinase
MTTNPRPQGIIYLRLSDLRGDDLGDDGRSTGLAFHERVLRGKAEGLGWDVPAGNVIVENDLAKSAKDGRPRGASAYKTFRVEMPGGRVQFRTNRPGFNKVLDLLAGGHASALLAMDIDRMMRNVRDLEDLLDIVRDRGLNVRTDGSIQLTDGGTDDERERARGAVNHAVKSSADTARRLRVARKRQAEAGTYGGGRRPYGFIPDPDAPKYRKTLLVVPAEAAEIRQAAAAVLRGESLKSLARDLRERGVPTVTGAKWSAEILRDVLLKESNAGFVGGHPATWKAKAILEEDVWRHLVTVLTDESRRTGTGNAPKYLLSGIARCWCGGGVKVNGGKRSPAYVCCDHAHLRRNAAGADAWVAMYVTELLSRPDAARLLTAPRASADAVVLRAERDVHLKRLTEAALDYDNDVITRAQRDAVTRRRRAGIDAIDRQLAAAHTFDVLDGLAGNPLAEKVWDGLLLERKRGVLRALVTVTLLPATRRGAGFDHDSVRVVPRYAS